MNGYGMRTDKNNPIVSIIVCTYNRGEILLDCLNSIAKSNYHKSGFEIIIVDNNSIDDTASLVARFQENNSDLNIEYIKEKKQGSSYARNSGAGHARGELLIFLDDDALVGPSYIKKYVRYYQEDGYVCMGGRILPWIKDASIVIPSWINRSNWGSLSMLDRGDEVKEVFYPYFPFEGNMVITRSLLQQFGTFNESMGRVGSGLNSNEGIEFLLRLQEAGIPVHYVPDVVIYHLVQKERLTYSFFFRRYYAQGKSDVQMLFIQGKASNVLLSMPRRIMEILFSPLKYMLGKINKSEANFNPVLRVFYSVGYLFEGIQLSLEKLLKIND